MKNGEYINRDELRERLERARHQSRNAGYRHGIEAAMGVANTMKGVYLQENTVFEINEASWWDEFNNVVKVGFEQRIEVPENLLDDNEVYFIELSSRKGRRAWRMYMTEEGIKHIEKQLHGIVEQNK